MRQVPALSAVSIAEARPFVVSLQEAADRIEHGFRIDEELGRTEVLVGWNRNEQTA